MVMDMVREREREREGKGFEFLGNCKGNGTANLATGMATEESNDEKGNSRTILATGGTTSPTDVRC